MLVFHDPFKEFKKVLWGKCVFVTFILDVHLALKGKHKSKKIDTQLSSCLCSSLR